MAAYANGEIPLSVLIRVPGQENDDAWLSNATCARWLALKKDVYDTYGVTIWIVPGYNAYRPLANQEYAKQRAINEGRPQDAANPGTSSHGGVYIQWGSPRNGQASLAIDAGGYESLNRADCYAICRKHGFEPGFFDWEPWHIIDWDPQIGVPGKDSTTSPEEDEMNFINIQGKSGARRGGCYAVFNMGGGKFAAEYIGATNLVAGPLVTDEGAIGRLQARISGLA